MEVVATGKLSTFAQQSKYNFIVDDLAPAGLGALMVMLEKRKKALEAEGLFAPDRKKPIPYLPEVIGVVTSPSGAVIRDILHRLRDRFPRKVLIWPVVVQGEKCAAEVAAAIRGFNALTPGGALPRPDVLIVARGGGSLEDLWGFNEELPVRAVADSDIPVISAVGHETDTTLIDYAADLRAPTPTAAAEHAVPVRVDLMATLASFDERRIRGMAAGLSNRRDRLRDLGRVLPKPQAILGERVQSFDGLSARLDHALKGLTERKRRELAERAGGFGPQALSGYLARRQDRIAALGGRLAPELARKLSNSRDQLRRTDRLSPDSIARSTRHGQERLAREVGQFHKALVSHTSQLKDRLSALERMRQTLGYKETLGRGYAVVRDGDGHVLGSLSAAKSADALDIEFSDGRLAAQRGKVSASKSPPSKPVKKPKADGGQGSLF
jgi:exodeoxyribonuclease VII large subunit